MTDVLANAPQAPLVAQHLEGEQLEDAVMKQIDYYFSRQNLATDAYLVSQMDADMWVPISTIAGFKKVHMLTNDVDFIVRVMSKSQNVTVDKTRMAMKPSWKLQRNTLILRDIPSDAPEEEVRALFAARPVTNVHSDIGDTWFVTFATEDDALDALMNINTISFRDKPVKARMKAEHLLKSSAVVQPYPQPYMIDPAAAYQAYRAYPQQYAQRAPYQPQQPYWEGQQQAVSGETGKAGGTGAGGAGVGVVGGDGRRGAYRGGSRRGERGGPTSPHGGGQAAPTTAGAHVGGGGGGRPRGNSQGGQAPFKGGSGGGDPSAAAAGGAKGRRKGKKGVEAKPVVTFNGVHPAPSVIVPQLNQQHFPSLPSPSSRLSKASFKSGYTTDFRKFTKDDILRIIHTVQDVTARPPTVIVAEPGVVEQKPNTDLEIERAPPTPDPSTLPDTLELTSSASSAVAAITGAPGLAVREWPVEKRSTPAATSTAPAPSAQAFVPKKQDSPQSSASHATSPPAPASAQSPPAQSPPAPAPSSTPQPATLRKSAEQNTTSTTEKDSQNTVPSSPSQNSEGLRNPSYADIALGLARTNSPPNSSNGKSPSLPPSSSSPLSTTTSLSAAPPAPPTSALEGKPQ